MAKYRITPSSKAIIQLPISIGHKAEKGVEAIEFDVTAWVETYGSGTLTVIMRRWGDAIPYPIALEIDENNKATWTLSDTDTAKAGMAYAQLSYIVGDEVVKKSDIYTFRVMDSLTGEGEPPEAYESWLEHLTHFAAEAMAEVLDIEGIVTDKTLTVDGGIADGKATGDALALKADKSTTYTKTEVDQMVEDVEVETDTTLEIAGAPADAAETGRQIGLIKAALDAIDTATSEDVGKALKAKTVTNGKVTEWEFGEAGSGDAEALEARVEKIETELPVMQNEIANSGTALCEFESTDGCLDQSGNIVNAHATRKEKYTSKIPVTAGETITYLLKYTEIGSFVVGLNWSTYDSEETFIRRQNLIWKACDATSYSGTFTIPGGVAYIVVDYSTGGMLDSFTLTHIGIIAKKVSALEEAFPSGSYIPERLNLVTTLDTSSSPQLVDISSLTKTDTGSQKRYDGVNIDFSQNGKYYINPLGAAKGSACYPRDSSNNNLMSGYIAFNAYDVLERVDDTHIIRYQYTSLANLKAGNVYSSTEYELTGTVAVLAIATLSGTDYDAGWNFGVTYNRACTGYIPYGADIDFNIGIYDGAWDYFSENDYFSGIPDKPVNPWNFRSHAVSDNLVDDTLFNWDNANTYVRMKTGARVFVSGGQTIICNKRMYELKWYDSNGAATSVGNYGEKKPYTLPDGAVSITFAVGLGNSDFQVPEDGYDVIYLHYTDTLYPADAVERNPVPMAQINGYDVSNNLYDQCIPEVGSNIIRMMKTFAVREMNHRQNAFRIGTFNIYVNNTWTNRATIKRELETYGLDMCCFQEARGIDGNNNALNIADYLKGWQFGYCNTNEDTSSNTRAVASAHEVISSEAFTVGTGSNSALKCVIQLPRYKDYANGLTTLSLYSIHLTSSSAAERAAEAASIIAKVAEDISDFIIVAGDTNDFSENKDVWAQFQTAGLTPVHDGSSETVTARNNSIDNIFVSSNITCLYYDVINSGEWTYKPTPTSAEQAVSDHDLLFADLQFNFDAVIAERSS